MIPKARILDSEYRERIARAAKLAAEKGLDVLLVNSNEADFSNVRYFSGFWPLFETSGVAIAPSGEAALIVGPESGAFGADVSRIPRVFPLARGRVSDHGDGPPGRDRSDSPWRHRARDGGRGAESHL